MLTAVVLAALLQISCATVPEKQLLDEEPIWGWKCVDLKRCEKILAQGSKGQPQYYDSLDVCKLQCGTDANLWPRPHQVTISETLATVNYNSINIDINPRTEQYSGQSLLQKAADRFVQQQLSKATKKDGTPVVKTGGRTLEVYIWAKDPSLMQLTLETDERYSLSIQLLSDGRINATINAENFFGARHGLETLDQLIVVDGINKELRLPSKVEIIDSPAYPYRGILLDTSRNFVSVEAIKRTINAMAGSKLNTFHWHITDSHSFPFVSKTYPKFHKYGAYTPTQVYTPEEIMEIVEYGLYHGVRVLPELDAPAHVGEGWQWVGDNTTVCVNAQPWNSFCVEPPCGQLNPTKDKIYEIIGGLYKDMFEVFKPDMFHMGGDEVNFNCWNSTESIIEWMDRNDLKTRDENDFLKLWDYFQSRAYEKLLEANNGKELPVVIWTSGLTAPGKVDKYLDPKKYIIQIWTQGNDSLIKELAEKKYKLIFSNYEALYFDCGFGAWVGEGNNWCSPYIGWQKVYGNDPKALLRSLGVDPKDANILGAEATLWTEQADSESVDGRLWPRAAAMAERLWSDPESTWDAAEYRMISHRERIVRLGVQAESLQPQWCLQNEGYCYGGKH